MTSTDELDQLWRDGLAAAAEQINPPDDPEHRVAIRRRRRRRRRMTTKVSALALVALTAITIATLSRRSDEGTRVTSPPARVPTAIVAVEDAPNDSLTIAFPGRSVSGKPPAIELPSGLIRFEVDGSGGHELVLDGPSGFRVQISSASAPSTTTDVQLSPGRYLMHCIIPGHAEVGEQARLIVTAP